MLGLPEPKNRRQLVTRKRKVSWSTSSSRNADTPPGRPSWLSARAAQSPSHICCRRIRTVAYHDSIQLFALVQKLLLSRRVRHARSFDLFNLAAGDVLSEREAEDAHGVVDADC